MTNPALTNAGRRLPLERRPHSLRALSSVAVSMYEKGMRLARRMVSMRDVAVTMCDEPAVSDVNR